jgi:hypothetical protein
MPSIEETIKDLRNFFELEREALSKKDSAYQGKFSAALQDELALVIDEHLKKWGHLINKTLEKFRDFPPQHNRHFEKLEEFWKDGSFEESIFIMTKYPEGNSPIDKQLQKVIDAVSVCITKHHYKPRLANNKKYHAVLWDNVELYLIGCKRGVAIVEDTYKKELNPNVTMEWGWMRAMNREVLYLVVEGFDQDRADLSGLIKVNFQWGNPQKSIEQAIKNWLPTK